MSLTLKIKRLKRGDDANGNADAVELPAYQSAGAAGMDVRAASDALLLPGQTALIATGFALEIPPGYEVQLRPRSGLALKHGITLPNAPATIDSDYRGEVGVILHNLGGEPFEIRRGDRIAQMVVARYERAQIVEVQELAASERGAGGFGHTGRG